MVVGGRSGLRPRARAASRRWPRPALVFHYRGLTLESCVPPSDRVPKQRHGHTCVGHTGVPCRCLILLPGHHQNVLTSGIAKLAKVTPNRLLGDRRNFAPGLFQAIRWQSPGLCARQKVEHLVPTVLGSVLGSTESRTCRIICNICSQKNS